MSRLNRNAGAVRSTVAQIVTLLLLAWLALPCQADPSSGTLPAVTLDFSELSFQPVDDLSFSGVTFDFKIGGIDSTEAFYSSYGPGMLTHLSDPSLTGDAAGILTIDFDVPTPIVEFAVALSTADALAPGATVELFNSLLQPVDVIPINTTALSGNLGFSEGVFAYDGMPVSRLVVQFNHQPGSFAVDNLRFLIIPEPATVLLTAMAALACTCSRPTRAVCNGR